MGRWEIKRQIIRTCCQRIGKSRGRLGHFLRTIFPTDYVYSKPTLEDSRRYCYSLGIRYNWHNINSTMIQSAEVPPSNTYPFYDHVYKNLIESFTGQHYELMYSHKISSKFFKTSAGVRVAGARSSTSLLLTAVEFPFHKDSGACLAERKIFLEWPAEAYFVS